MSTDPGTLVYDAPKIWEPPKQGGQIGWFPDWGIQLRPEEMRTHFIFPQVRMDSTMPPDAIRVQGKGHYVIVYNFGKPAALEAPDLGSIW